MSEGFVESAPTPESVWRAIILFGKNTATYKFAPGLALLGLGGAHRGTRM